MSNIYVQDEISGTSETETEAARVTDENAVKLNVKIDKLMAEKDDLELNFQQKEQMDSIFKFFIVIVLAVLFALLFNSCTNVANENKKLKLQVVQLIQEQKEQAVLNSYTFSCPVEFTMTNFEQHKHDRSNWPSPPFYTHPEGYRMCLSVYADGVGAGNGSHISVFIRIMQGQFDDQLKWPFQGNFTITLLEDKKHRHVHFTKTVPVDSVSSRAFEKEANRGWGLEKFIAHADLQSKNNYLKLRVDLKKE